MIFRITILCLTMLSVQVTALLPFVSAEDNKVAIMWVGKSAMTKRVMLGFAREVKKIAPNLQVTRSMEIPSMSEAEGKFRAFEETMDSIVFLRSNGAKFLAKLDHPPKCPALSEAATIRLSWAQ